MGYCKRESGLVPRSAEIQPASSDLCGRVVLRESCNSPLNNITSQPTSSCGLESSCSICAHTSVYECVCVCVLGSFAACWCPLPPPWERGTSRPQSYPAHTYTHALICTEVCAHMLQHACLRPGTLHTIVRLLCVQPPAAGHGLWGGKNQQKTDFGKSGGGRRPQPPDISCGSGSALPPFLLHLASSSVHYRHLGAKPHKKKHSSTPAETLNEDSKRRWHSRVHPHSLR